jgi:transposase
MDDAALLDLPDDPIALKRIVIERNQIIVQRDESLRQRDESLRQRDESLRQRDESLRQRDESLRQRDETIQLLNQDNQLLRHRLANLLRSSYGPRAERFDPRQLLLFGLLVPPVELAPPAREKSKSSKRHQHGRQKLPTHLPRVPIEHDLGEAEKNCPCCGELRRRIGCEQSEQLEYVPANFVVIEHRRYKYACAHCNSGQCQTCDGKAQIEIAAKAAQGVDKCLAGPGLLAHVVTGKLCDHLPLHRLEQIFSRQKVQINRSTLSGWMNAAAKVAAPLYELMCDRVKQSDVLHTDDTIVPIQNQGHCRQGRLWTYVGDENHPYIVYDFTPTRAASGPLAWLGNWKGFLQADAYAGYDKLFARGDVTEVACWAHARRKFFDAQESDAPRALWMLEMIRRLYGGEQEAQDLLKSRQTQSVPILEQIRAWLIEQQTRVLPRSPIAGAIGYCLNQWPALIVYASDARLSIDNNVSERALRRVAVGRKNWLFAGHDESAMGQAILWSLIASAQRHGIEVEFYLRSVLARLPALSNAEAPTTPAEELQNYLPDAWKRDLMAEQAAKLATHHAKLLGAVRA